MRWRRRRRQRGGITTIYSDFIIIHDHRLAQRQIAYEAMLAYYGAYGDCEGMGV